MKSLTCVLAVGATALVLAGTASAQSLTGSVTDTVSAATTAAQPVVKPVTDTLSTAAKPVTDTASAAAAPVTDSVSGATGGSGGGATSGGGSTSGGSTAGSDSGTGSGTTVLVRDGEKWAPGAKQDGGAAGGGGAGGGGGGGAQAVLAAAAAERLATMQQNVQEWKQDRFGSDGGVIGTTAEGREDGGGRTGPFGLSLPENPEFPFNLAGFVLLGLLGLGLGGVVAVATSHVLGRMRSS